MNGSEDRDQALTTELHRQVSALGDSALTFDEVRGRARRIQRRRRLAAAAGTAAAVAIVLPAAVWGPGLLRSDAPPPIGTTQSPTGPSTSPTPSQSPTPSVPPTEITPGPEPQDWKVGGLAVGAPPGVAYVDHGTLVLPGDQEFAVGPDFVSGAAGLADGRWLITTSDPETGDATITVRAHDGAALATYPTWTQPVVGVGHETAAWIDPQQRVMVLDSGSDTARALASVDALDVQVSAVAGSCASACQVYVMASDRSGPRALVISQDGTTKPVTPALPQISGVSAAGDLIAMTEVTADLSTCSDYRPAGGGPGWDTCNHLLRAFAPDAQHIFAANAYGSGWGSTELAVYDSTTGQPVLNLVRAGRKFAGYQDAVWEDDAHLLVTTYDRGEWAVVRIGLDGSQDYAVPPIRGTSDDNALRLVS